MVPTAATVSAAAKAPTAPRRDPVRCVRLRANQTLTVSAGLVRAQAATAADLTPEGNPVVANETTMTITGNLTDNPDYRVTPQGVGLVRFTIASTPRIFDQKTSQWRDGEPLFLSCSAWRDLAENIAESLTKGARVVVTGRLRLNRWETPEGDKRQQHQLDVDDIGASLRYAQAKIRKLTRQNAPGSSNDNSSNGSGPGSAPVGDPWGSNSPTGGGGFDTEPPF